MKNKILGGFRRMVHFLVRIFPAKWWALLFLWALYIGVSGNWHAAMWCAIASCGMQAIAEAERNSNKQHEARGE